MEEPSAKITTTASLREAEAITRTKAAPATTEFALGAAEQTLQQPLEDPYSLFIYAMKSPATREKYVGRMRRFFKFLGLEGMGFQEQCATFAERGRSDRTWAFAVIVRYLQFHRERVERKEIAGATLRNHVKTIKLFCLMADIEVPWRKIAKGLPKERKFADDRAPTIEEIKKVTEYPDRRIKPIVYTMLSSGIRLGAWDYLRWCHVKPIHREGGMVVAARLTVYGAEEDEYTTFITPEAYAALKQWMDYRQESGEPITEKSWLMRNLWDTSRPYGKGMITAPKRLKSAGVKRLMERALWAQGVRKKLDEGKVRHPFAADHGFRKYFKSRAEQVMRPINVEVCMGHSTGVSDSYYRPTEGEILEDYVKAVPALTVCDEVRLRAQLYGAQKDVAQIEGMRSDLREKERTIEALLSRQANLEQFVQSLVDSGAVKPVAPTTKEANP